MKKFLLKRPFSLSVVVLSVLASALFFILLATNMDAKTGFYENEINLFRILFIAVLVICFALGFVIRVLLRKKGLLPVNMKFDFSRFLSERVTLAVLCLGFLVNTFYEIYRYLNPLPSLTLTRTVTTFSLLTALLSAASLIYFIFVAFLIENHKVAASVLSILPAAWVAIRLLRNFIGYTVVFYMPKNMLTVLYLCCLLITLFSLSRLLSGTDSLRGFRSFAIFAPITSVLGFTLSIPFILGLIFSLKTVSVTDAVSSFADLALSLFLLRFSMHIFKEN